VRSFAAKGRRRRGRALAGPRLFGGGAATRYILRAMQRLKAHVRNGRLILDDEERERLHQSIERGIEDVSTGRTVDARKVVEELRARAGR
jgi:hypothetical protein